MHRQKADAGQIRAFLKDLKRKPWLARGERQWWPRFVFHYTDVRNVIKILKGGRLLSRTRAEEQHVLEVSSGSPRELAQTEDWIRDCVRLYFRPRTPTQFYAEGIQSKETLSRSRYPQDHCPIPVYLLFDSGEVLTRADCKFSDGGLNSPPYKILCTAHELADLEWDKIYHTGKAGWRPEITHRRNAEIIVPGQLQLTALQFVVCRSSAECETLLYLLPRQLRHRYQKRIKASSRRDLFFRGHTFVRTARLSSESATFFFSPDTLSPGPFHLRVELVDDSGSKRCAEEKQFYARESLQLHFRQSLVSYTIRLTLDGHPAYANRYEEIDIPF